MGLSSVIWDQLQGFNLISLGNPRPGQELVPGTSTKPAEPRGAEPTCRKPHCRSSQRTRAHGSGGGGCLTELQARADRVGGHAPQAGADAWRFPGPARPHSPL